MKEVISNPMFMSLAAYFIASALLAVSAYHLGREQGRRRFWRELGRSS